MTEHEGYDIQAEVGWGLADWKESNANMPDETLKYWESAFDAAGRLIDGVASADDVEFLQKVKQHIKELGGFT